jgi:recombination protein RecR
MSFAKPLAELISELERLPGVGPKSAQRLAFHILRAPYDDIRRLADTLTHTKKVLKLCNICQNISDQDRCILCTNAKRHTKQICVVAEPQDIAAIERTHVYKGSYHVLHGLLNPMQNVGPEELKIRELLSRITPEIEEIILATNPTIEGDATALYLTRLLKPNSIKITKLAHGMPIGAELDYADSATLLSALENRRDV